MTAPDPTVVLLAAGVGSRYGGPKQLDPVGPDGALLLDYALADAARAGFGEAVLVVSEVTGDAVAAHLRSRGASGLPWRTVLQTLETGPAGTPGEGVLPPARSKPWGTAHAALVAAREVKGPWAVANADDHYGPEAWERLGAWLAVATGRDAGEAVLVGYRLGRTLSPHGGVSRGVCVTDDDGRLREVAEWKDVRRDDDGVVRGRRAGAPDATREPLDPELPASMNLWGCTPAVTRLLEAAFADFLAGEPGPDRELHLPDVVGRAVADGRLVARVLPGGRDWFGVTWPEDRADVVRRLAERGPPAEGRGDALRRAGSGP